MTKSIKVAIVGVVAAAVISVFAVKGNQRVSESSNLATEKTVAAMDSPDPVEPVAQNVPRLLEIGADKCIPCRAMQPILAELRKDYGKKLKVDFIDVWKNPKAGDEYKVSSIPTQVFFDAKGEEVFRHVGFYAKADIVAKLKELGFGL